MKYMYKPGKWAVMYMGYRFDFGIMSILRYLYSIEVINLICNRSADKHLRGKAY
jgi:hypothetical protein